MFSGQSVELSEPVSEQMHGIVLHWQPYQSGAVQGGDHNYCFVPKFFHSGSGRVMWLSNQTGNHVTPKYIYVGDTELSGSDYNNRDATNTSSGITIEPKWFVLTEVFGV